MDSKDILNLQEAYLEIYQDIDEATRMRKELGKEGEIETRKELAARSRAYKHSGSVDRTIAAAERGSNNPYIKHKRDESDADRKKREERQSKTLRDLAASRRKSVRGRDDSLRGYAAKVEGDDKDLQSARGSARSAGTLTPAEKKKFGESYDVYDIILSHLLDEGYADTQESAEAIMVNMSEEWRESIIIDEGLDMKTFKANLKKAKASAARADAKKRGHVGKEWYNSGRTYSPDEARRGRENMDDEERSTRHRSSVDPEGDDSNYSADKTKNPKKLRKQKAMGEH